MSRLLDTSTPREVCAKKDLWQAEQARKSGRFFHGFSILRKSLMPLLAFVLVLFLSPLIAVHPLCAAETPLDPPVEGEVFVERAFVRSSPSNRAKVVTKLSEGDVVDIVAELIGEAKLPWYKVRTDEGEGWVYGQFLRRLDGDGPKGIAPSPEESSAATPTPVVSGSKAPSKSPAAEEAPLETSEKETVAFTFGGKDGASPDEDAGFILTEAEGKGKSRDEALERAWTEAIRYAVGMMIDAKTEVTQSEISEKIIAHSRGVVEKYEVLMADDGVKQKGVYSIRIKAWVRKETLRDGLEYVAKQGSVVSFSMSDLKPAEPLDAKALEGKDAGAATRKSKAEQATELLNAFFARLRMDDFLGVRMVGKLRPVENAPDTFEIDVELRFNEKLYREQLIPELTRVLEQVSEKNRRGYYRDPAALAAIREIPNGREGSESAYLQYGYAEIFEPNEYLVIDRPELFSFMVYKLPEGVRPSPPVPLDAARFVFTLLDKSGGEIFSTEEKKIAVRGTLSTNLPNISEDLNLGSTFIMTEKFSYVRAARPGSAKAFEFRTLNSGDLVRVIEIVKDGEDVFYGFSTKEGMGWVLKGLFRNKITDVKHLEVVSIFPSILVTDERKKTTVECLKYTLPVSFVVPREVLPLVKSIRLDRLR